MATLYDYFLTTLFSHTYIGDMSMADMIRGDVFLTSIFGILFLLLTLDFIKFVVSLFKKD